MKKILCLTSILLLTNLITGCSKKEQTEFYVTFNYLDQNLSNKIYKVNKGDKVTKPPFNGHKNYIDVEWHIDSKLNNLYDFELPVYKSFELYAKFIEEDQIIDKYYNVTFKYCLEDYEDKIVKVKENEKVEKITPSDTLDYQFKGWYIESSYINLYDFNYLITEDITLYAKWDKKNNDNNNGNIQSNFNITKNVIDINLETYEDPYVNVDKTEFYKNYTIASSYEDAYYRAQHGLLCGEYIEEDGSLPSINNPKDSATGLYLKNSNVTYEVDKDNNYISYNINTLNNQDYKIYYGGVYTSFNDVAAYLFAFNEIPINYLPGTSKSAKKLVQQNYGELGRLNFKLYSGPSATKYQYEPYLYGQKEKTVFYREIDFGANTGSNIYFSYGGSSRQIFRFLLGNSFDNNYSCSDTTWSTPNPTTIDERRVYFTYNHYNDFTEYLNYYNGFGKVFGNVSAGNSEGYYNPNNPPTEYEETILSNF